MNDTELLRSMTIRLITRVSALEAATEALLAAHAHLHGMESLDELITLMRMLPPRLPGRLPESMDAQLRTDHRWHLDDLCENASRARSVLPSDPPA